MFKLEKKYYPAAYKLYRDGYSFFPLIAAVLTDEQDGIIYVDNHKAPAQVYVEHHFGFAQLFGESLPSSIFLNKLETYLLVKRNFHSGKVRLYSPITPDFLLKSRKEVSISERQRFHLDQQLFLDQKKDIPYSDVKDIQLLSVEKKDVTLIERKFNVINRFWRNQDDFLKKAGAYMVIYQKKPAAICYSAATVAGCAEIDVLSLTPYRKIGLASYAITNFIKKCNNFNIQPLWDCYTNNEASMMLANSLGFVPYNAPYKFFTINK